MWMNLQTEVKMNRHAFVLAHGFVTTLEQSATCKNEIMSQFSGHSGWNDSAFLTSQNVKTSFFVWSKEERGTAFEDLPFDILNVLPFALSEIWLRKLNRCHKALLKGQRPAEDASTPVCLVLGWRPEWAGGERILYEPGWPAAFMQGLLLDRVTRSLWHWGRCDNNCRQPSLCTRR